MLQGESSGPLLAHSHMLKPNHDMLVLRNGVWTVTGD